MLKPEDWEYLTANWSSSDENVMNRIAEIRNADTLTTQELEGKLTDAQKDLEALRVQNQTLNNTNISLIMRMTDPNDPRNNLPDDDGEEEYTPPKFDDYDAFVIGKK